jgi:hypothetical protein
LGSLRLPSRTELYTNIRDTTDKTGVWSADFGFPRTSEII